MLYICLNAAFLFKGRINIKETMKDVSSCRAAGRRQTLVCHYCSSLTLCLCCQGCFSFPSSCTFCADCVCCRHVESDASVAAASSQTPVSELWAGSLQLSSPARSSRPAEDWRRVRQPAGQQCSCRNHQGTGKDSSRFYYMLYRFIHYSALSVLL